MNKLSEKRNFLQKFKDGVIKFIGPAISFSETHIAETQKDMSEATIENSRYLQLNKFEENVYLQVKREAVQAEQMKLSWIQHQENLALQEQLEQDRQAAMPVLVELNRQRSLEIQKFNQEHQKKLEKYRAIVQLAILDKNLDFQKWKLEQEKELQLRIIDLRQAFEHELAQYNRETALKTIREQRRLTNSPITLVSDDLLESPYRDGIMPLRIFLSPPELNYDSFGQKSFGFNIENHLAESLRDFLEKYYPFEGENRQTQLLDGAWVSKKFRGGAGIHALYSQLKAVPTVVLESEVDNNYLNFRVAYWRGDGSEYQYKSILSSFPYRDFLYESVRERARKWQETKEKLLAEGETVEEVNSIGGDNEFNLLVLQKEQKRLAQGIDPRDLEIYKQYKISYKDFEDLHQYLVISHCIIISLIADIHYFSPVNNIIPLLPNILPELLEDIDGSETLQKILLDCLISEYHQMYERLEQVIPGIIPELMINFAVALSNLEDKSYAKQQGENSVASWLRFHKIETYSRDELLSVISEDNKPYFKSLQKLIENLGDSDGLTLTKKLLEDWLLLNELRVVPDTPKVHVEDIPEAEEIPEVEDIPDAEEIPDAEVDEVKIEVFSDFTEILPNNVRLEMVAIPSGELMMGSNEQNNEQPIHHVKIQSFYMSKYPITQAQYEAVMGKNTSRFKGNNRPVEQVTWHNAVEFCYRLSQQTGKTYQLPSESRWEYACRAGSTTKYHFGDNENQLGYYAWYGSNSSKQTHPVGQKEPNQYGLYDMHGNVWEWCADDWHNNYEGAPTDGSVWYDGNSNYSPLRGGSWANLPDYCSSTFRDSSIGNRRVNIGSNVVGLRIVCELDKVRPGLE